MPARGLNEQRAAKRASLGKRVELAAALVAKEPGEPWLAWVELNDEGDELTEAIPDAVQVAGSDSVEHKERTLLEFADGQVATMVSKASIAGHGMNFQICARMVFVGVTHSFEQFFQAVRRCHRFGQKRPVHVHIICGELESEVLENLRRKEDEAGDMLESMVTAMRGWQGDLIQRASREFNAYEPGSVHLPEWMLP